MTMPMIWNRVVACTVSDPSIGQCQDTQCGLWSALFARIIFGTMVSVPMA